MISIYFVRHGQAGTRDSYDSLSDLGRRQARLLGEYFLAQGVVFTAAFSGTQERQQQTAREVAGAYAAAGMQFPFVAAQSGWNEFDLDQIYREMAPQLSAEDAEFRRQYDVMREQVRASRGVHGAEIHRRWTPCDVAMVSAWIGGRHAYSGESWDAFRQRVSANDPLPPHAHGNGTAHATSTVAGATERSNVVVFTSATPTAVWVGRAMDIHDERVMQLAGALLNASYSVVRRRESGQLQLFMFNAVPHLPATEMRTRR